MTRERGNWYGKDKYKRHPEGCRTSRTAHHRLCSIDYYLIFCLFWFYIMFINATRSNGELQSGFTAIPSTNLLKTGTIWCTERFQSGMECLTVWSSPLARQCFVLISQPWQHMPFMHMISKWNGLFIRSSWWSWWFRHRLLHLDLSS